jgi:hypothetical protein
MEVEKGASGEALEAARLELERRLAALETRALEILEGEGERRV